MKFPENIILNVGTVSQQNQSEGDNRGMDEEPASNAGYIVIVVIIIVLILVALVVFGLHYKRKLPESFYNLGGLIKGDKQWKPVLSKVCFFFQLVSQLMPS